MARSSFQWGVSRGGLFFETPKATKFYDKGTRSKRNKSSGAKSAGIFANSNAAEVLDGTATGGLKSGGKNKDNNNAASVKPKRGISWKDSPKYDHTGMVEVSFPLTHQPGKSTKFNFDALLEYTVNFVRKRFMKGASGFTILPYDPDDKTTQHIRGKEDFPDRQMDYDDYFHFKTHLPFKNMNKFGNV